MCECDRVLYASLRYSAIKRGTAVKSCHDGSHPEYPCPCIRNRLQRMPPSPSSVLDGFHIRNPRTTRGRRRHRRAHHEAGPSPIRCRSVWTFRIDRFGSSHPRRLASKVVIPPVRGHRQLYEQAHIMSKNTQRRDAVAPRRCCLSVCETMISGRSPPRESHG